MNIFVKLITNFKDFYNEINTATLTGAIDVVVVRQEDGSYLSSPFHVRFGKLGVLRSKEKIVDIEINGEPVDIHMKLGYTGEAYFLHPVEDDAAALLSLQEEASKAEEEARSQDSGYEPEDLCERRAKDAPDTLTLRLPVDPETLKLIEENDLAPEMGIITRVPRQDSSKFVMKDIQTQTEKKKASVTSAPGEDKDSSSADEVLSKTTSSSKKTDKSASVKSEPAIISDTKPKTDNDDYSKGSRNQRRKRRRKCKNNSNQQMQQQQQQQLQVVSSQSSSNKGSKKKGSSGSQSSDASTTSEVADITSLNSSKDDGVFAMDDVEKPKKMDIPQSSSMPLLREAPAGSMKPSHSAGTVEGATATQYWAEDNSGRTNISSNELGPNFHPFSDTDISPPPSPNNSRASTPIKSDTEYEVERQRQELNGENEQAEAEDIWNWTWGQLPTPPVKSKQTAASKGTNEVPVGDIKVPVTADLETRLEPMNNLGSNSSHDNSSEDDIAAIKEDVKEAQRSVFGGMLSFMRATKRARHNPESEGIYLEDLNLSALDPEVAALYFPKFSSSQSGAVPIPGAKEEDLESGNGTSLPQSPQSVGEGGAVGAPSLDLDLEQESFRHPIFDYKGYNDVAMSRCGHLQQFRNNEMPESLFLQNLVTYDEFCVDPSTVLNSPDLVVRLGGQYFNWASAAPHMLSLMLFQRGLPEVVSQDLKENLMPPVPKKELEPTNRPSGGRVLSWWWGRGSAEEEKKDGEEVTDLSDQKKIEEETANGDEEQLSSENEKDTVEVRAIETQTSSPPNLTHQPSGDSDSPLKEESGKKYSRSLRLTSEQIEQLNLKDGSNDVVFSVTTAYQGTTRCRCRIFLWNYDEKIIVSDIDGTITKSDVLGQLMPIIGRDWAQGGVAQLFTKIKNNGYNFLYLSARAIGQATITRDYLRSVVQEDVNLPDGPLLLNPTSLLQAFHREVIERKSEEFKISCLKDIQALFPVDSNPFYAGYGNRVNDVWAYSAVGIPISRVFTINHKGELKHELTQTFQSTYSNLSAIVHHMFPVYSQEMLHHGEYSSVRYWKAPLPNYEDEINKLLNLVTPATTQA